MNSIRKWIRDIFGFSGNEINGFLILVPVMLLFIFSAPIYSTLVANRAESHEEDTKNLDSLVTLWNVHLADSIKTTSGAHRVPLFAFEPNTASIEQLRLLGFSQTLATRIAAYRHKGGTFRIKSDLMNIYGLDSTLYKQLYTYILLPSERILPSDRDRPRQVSKLESSERKSVKEAFDINTADTLILKAVYGIGSKLAARIVKFRDGLGGFINPEQLSEVYGLDSMVVNRLLKISFIKEGFIPLKININTADEQQLSAHPYIRYKIAQALVTYRFQHGDFMDVRDIKKLALIKPEEVERFLPYVKVKD